MNGILKKKNDSQSLFVDSVPMESAEESTLDELKVTEVTERAIYAKRMSDCEELQNGWNTVCQIRPVAAKNSASSEVARAIAEAALRAESDDNEARLISKLAEYVNLESQYVQPFGAPSDALEFVCRAFLESGDEALIAGPCHTLFRSCAEHCGALIRLSLSGDPFQSDLSSLAQCITPQTKLIYLMSPSDPCGSVWTINEIERLLARISGALVIVDEAYFEFYGQTCSQLVKRYDNLIALRRLDRTLGMSSCPCSYALASPSILKRLNAARINRSIAGPIQAGAVAALDNTRLSGKYIRQIRENSTYLALRLQQFGLDTKTTHTGRILLKVAHSALVVNYLREGNISSADCSALPQMDYHVLVTVGDNEYCANVIQRFSDMPKEYYLFASLESQTTGIYARDNSSAAMRGMNAESPSEISRKLVLRRGAVEGPGSVVPDVAGRLLRPGTMLSKHGK